MSLTKTPTSMIDTTGATTGQVLTYNGSTSTWVASAAPSPASSSNAFAAKAWVNFDATRNAAGAVDSSNTSRFIRSSFNVSSVLKTGTGDYVINFTNAMNDANYCSVASAGGGDNTSAVAAPMWKTPPTAASVQMTVVNSAFSGVDRAYNNVIVFA